MAQTLAIDDDVIEAARPIADREGRPLEAIVSEMARQGIARVAPIHEVEDEVEWENGIPLLPRRPGAVVTLELVERLKDELF